MMMDLQVQTNRAIAEAWDIVNELLQRECSENFRRVMHCEKSDR